MPKLRRLRNRVVVKVLKHNGFGEVRGHGKGSHKKFRREDDDGVRITMVPNYPEIEIVLLQLIMKQTGKSRNDFV